VIVGDRVYIGSSDGRFYVLDTRKGDKLWEFDMGGPVTASPAVASGRIVIGSQDGRVVCFT
jgi:outer membrane protein assembly factor BamB